MRNLVQKKSASTSSPASAMSPVSDPLAPAPVARLRGVGAPAAHVPPTDPHPVPHTLIPGHTPTLHPLPMTRTDIAPLNDTPGWKYLFLVMGMCPCVCARLQLQDPSLRRHVLLQLLILFQHLTHAHQQKEGAAAVEKGTMAAAVLSAVRDTQLLLLLLGSVGHAVAAAVVGISVPLPVDQPQCA